MALFTSQDFKQYGPNILKTDANKIALAKGVVKADSYAAATAKVIAVADFAASDVTFSASGNNLACTFAAKSGITPTGTAASTDDLVVIVYSTASSKVHLCQDAANRDINNTDPVNIPSFVFTVNEPAAA